MPTPLYIDSNEVILYIKHNGLFVPIGCQTNTPIEESVEMLETTTRDNGGWKTEIPTKQSYSLPVEGYVVKDTNNDYLSYYKLRSLKRSRTKIEWKRTTLDSVYVDSGFGYISAISDANTVNDFVTFTMTINGFGKPIYELNGVITDRYFEGYFDEYFG